MGRRKREPMSEGKKNIIGICWALRKKLCKLINCDKMIII